MTKTKRGISFLFIALLTGQAQLHAAEHEHEQHEAHVHGEAQLLVALEGNALEIEFVSPAMNIVGFEHQPANEAQMHAVESAIDTLKQPGQLFSIPSAAKCDPVSIEVESPLAGHDDHEHEHEHGDEHEHEKEYEEETHSDFTGHYHFKCADIAQLKQIEIKLFKAFPGTEAIEVQSISNRGQQKIDLTPGHNTLQL